MSNRATAIAIGIFILIISGVFYILNGSSFRGVLSRGAEPQPFREVGNLVRNTPGFEPDMWYLVYERYGQPGFFIPIRFDKESLCHIESTTSLCGDIRLEPGMRADVTGIQDTESVLVQDLIFMQSAE